MAPSVSVSTWFDFNSTKVMSSTVCDMDRHFHNLSFRKSSFQSKGGVYRLLGVLHSVFFFGELSCNVIAWPYVVHSLLVKAKSRTRFRMVSLTNKTIQMPEALFKMIND